MTQRKSVRVDGVAMGGTVTGAIAVAGPKKVRAHLTLTAEGERTELIVVDRALYVNEDGKWSKEWLDDPGEVAGDDSVDRPSAADLADFQKMLAGSLSDLGPDEVAGAAVTHYRSELKLSDVMPTPTTKDERELGKALEGMGEADLGRIDIYLGPDSLPVKVDAKLSMPMNLDDEPPMTVSLTFSKWGVPVAIEAPDVG